MSTAWPPPVGARVRPVETAAETVSPDGDPVPAPGAGPMWARLRYAPPSAGDDRREGMVADVCDDDARAPTASVVWEDGAEEDGVPLARLGPVVDARPDDDPTTAASNARERGNARFRAGDHAAAAAEYVEACAWLVRAIPTGARALPGRAERWRVPGASALVAEDENEERDVPGETRTDDRRVPTAPFRPTVGARVRVLGADGASRSGMVSYVESDEELCDVLFDDDDGAGGGDEEEEVGVPFHRLFGVAEPITDRSNHPASIGDDDAAIEERLRRRSAAEASAAEADRVVAALAECLLNVARCHLKLSDTKSGGSVAAHACADAASAALSVRRSAAAFYLRGRAKTVTCRFRSAGEDLRAALAVAARVVVDVDAAAEDEAAEREEEKRRVERDLFGVEDDDAEEDETSQGEHVGDSHAREGTKSPSEDRSVEDARRLAASTEPSAAADERAIRAAIRALKVAAKRRADDDRRLARAIMGHMRDAEVVDFGLDPASQPTFASLPAAATRGKDGEVPLAKVGEAVRDHVLGKVKGARRCVIS